MLNSKQKIIAGPNSAKRKIQIRQYIQDKQNKKKCFSDPFDNTVEEGDSIKDLNPRLRKFNFTRKYKVEKENNDSSDDSDEILSGKINLDEADKFIASLKLPKKRKRKSTTNDKQFSSMKFISSTDFQTFKEESDKLMKLRIADSQDQSDEDDNII